MPYEFIFLKGLFLTIGAELAAGISARIIIKKLSRPVNHTEKISPLKTNILPLKLSESLKKISWSKYSIGIALASTLTLPYVWFIFPLIQPRWLFSAIAEIFAWLMEAIFYRYFFEWKWHTTIFFSFGLNLFSYLLGILIFQYI